MTTLQEYLIAIGACSPSLAAAEQGMELDVACDRHYIAGLKLGWNLGISDNRPRMLAVIEARSREIRAARSEVRR